MIWSSSLLLYGHPHQALLAATLLLLVSREWPGSSQKPRQGPPEVKGTRQRVVELTLYLPLLPWLRTTMHAATQTSLQPAHPSPSVLIPAASLSSQALRTMTSSFLAQFPGENAVKLCQSRSHCPHQWLQLERSGGFGAGPDPLLLLSTETCRRKVNTRPGTGCCLLSRLPRANI